MVSIVARAWNATHAIARHMTRRGPRRTAHRRLEPCAHSVTPRRHGRAAPTITPSRVSRSRARIAPRAATAATRTVCTRASPPPAWLSPDRLHCNDAAAARLVRHRDGVLLLPYHDGVAARHLQSRHDGISADRRAHGGDLPVMPRRRRLSRKATTCASCHQADYNQTTNPNHASAAVPHRLRQLSHDHDVARRNLRP